MSEAVSTPNSPTDSHAAKPYVFVCYSHEDAARVYPRVAFLQADGIDVWVDRHIVAGTKWRNEITDALERATHVVFFVSSASLASDRCEVEVHYGLDHNKTVVPVYIEDVPLSSAMRVELSRVQALHGYRLADDALDSALRTAIRGGGSAARGPAIAVTIPKPRSPRRTRGIWLGVALAASVAVGSGLWWSSPTQHTAPLPTRSVAVLPFTAIGDEPRMPHLAGAFVEALLNDLTAQRQLQVASSTASASRRADQSVPAFAASLGVSYVVEGSVRSGDAGDRVTMHVTRGRDGLHLLSQTLDLGVDDADLDGVATRAALNTFLYIDNDVLIAQARTQTRNDAAFEAYEKAFRLPPGGQGADTGVAREQHLRNLEKAIELDPNFAEPYLERALHATGGFGGRLDRDQARRETRNMLDRYLALRPDSARATTLLGVLHADEGDLVAAEVSLKRACELDPQFPWPYKELGDLAMRRGNAQEAADYYKQATLNDSARPSHFAYGVALFALERYDEADREFEIWQRIEPSDVDAEVMRIWVAHLRGHDDEAKSRFDVAWAKYGRIEPKYFVPVLPLVGHADWLRDLMRGWDADGNRNNAGMRFYAHYALGEYDSAVEWLLRAMDEHTAPGFIRVASLYPAIHAHARYAEVAAKLGAQEVSH